MTSAMRPSRSDAEVVSSAAKSRSTVDLRDERDRFVAFAFAGADLLLEVAKGGRILFAAGAAKALAGIDAGQLIGKALVSLLVEHDRRVLEEVLKRVINDGRADPVTIGFAQGENIVHAIFRGCSLPGKSDSIYFAVSAIQAAVAGAALRGKRDLESGLLDGAAFNEAARETLVAANDSGDNLELALVRLQGLDDLRSRTDGDTVGRLLGDIGAFLRTHSVGGNAAGRLAADKFGLIRPRGAAKIALGGEIEKLSRAYDPKGKGLQAGEIEVGLNTEGITSDDAAKALAFTLGRFATARAEEFSITSLAQGFKLQIAETVQRISRLKSAANEKNMTVAFQPIVALGSHALHHHEMLVRFEQNKSPFEMIQFAEKVGMIEEIDLSMCQRAISVLCEQQGPPLDLAVNISGKSLDSDMFVQALMKLLEPHAYLSEQLLFEVTESTAMPNLPRIDRILAALRKAGHRICLDDFGAGASSFPYLQALSIDFVKIDGVYVTRMGDSAKDRAILKAMVNMCRDLGVGMIAEMIERVDQAHDLLEMGIGFGQGYLFGRPSPTLTVAAHPLGAAAGVSQLPGITRVGK